MGAVTSKVRSMSRSTSQAYSSRTRRISAKRKSSLSLPLRTGVAETVGVPVDVDEGLGPSRRSPAGAEDQPSEINSADARCSSFSPMLARLICTGGAVAANSASMPPSS